MNHTTLTELLIEIRLRCGGNREAYDAAVARLKRAIARSQQRRAVKERINSQSSDQ